MCSYKINNVYYKHVQFYFLSLVLCNFLAKFTFDHDQHKTLPNIIAHRKVRLIIAGNAKSCCCLDFDDLKNYAVHLTHARVLNIVK